MSDYIKREDALEQFDYYDLDEYLTPAIRGILMDIPSADAAPVRHGTWEISMKDYNLYDCSNCHKVTMFETWGGEVKPYGYCPNCGAKMDEGGSNGTDNK